MIVPSLPTAQNVYPGSSVTSHAELIDFLKFQQRQIESLQSAVRGPWQHTSHWQPPAAAPETARPALAVGQRWRRRDGEVVTIDKHNTGETSYPFHAGCHWYRADGTSCIDSASCDLIELVSEPALAAPQSESIPRRLQWTENRPPSEECRYDHCIAETPFGRFLITWKGWGRYDSPTVDETPWGEWYGAFGSVDEAKSACQLGLDRRLRDCAALSTQPNPTP